MSLSFPMLFLPTRFKNTYLVSGADLGFFVPQAKKFFGLGVVSVGRGLRKIIIMM
jgi:hypothetical protein